MVVNETEYKIEIVFLDNAVEVYNEVCDMHLVDLTFQYFLLFIVLETEIDNIESVC